MLAAKRLDGGLRRCAGGRPVVDHDHAASSQFRQRTIAAVPRCPTLDLGHRARTDLFNDLLGDAELLDERRVQVDGFAKGNRPQGQLFLARRAELADHQDVKRRVKLPRHLEPHRDATPRQGEHDRPPEVRQPLHGGRQHLAGLTSVPEDEWIVKSRVHADSIHRSEMKRKGQPAGMKRVIPHSGRRHLAPYSVGMASSTVAVIPGSAHPAMAADIARILGAPLVPVHLERFPDGELSVQLLEAVRGLTAVVVQPTGPPVDANLIELLALVDACRRAAAERVIAVVPYLGYARGDRRHGRSEPIMASLTARLLETAGVAHLLAVDLHAPQIEGFFQIPVDDLSPFPALLAAVRSELPPDVVVISPDLGRLGLATRYADELHTTAAVVHKRRLSGRESRPLQVIGDVRDRPCLIVDDMITTGGTIAGCIDALLDNGARAEILVVATHGLFVAGAEDRLHHPAIRRLWVTDTLPQRQATTTQGVIPVAPLIADALRRLQR